METQEEEEDIHGASEKRNAEVALIAHEMIIERKIVDSNHHLSTGRRHAAQEFAALARSCTAGQRGLFRYAQIVESLRCADRPGDDLSRQGDEQADLSRASSSASRAGRQQAALD